MAINSNIEWTESTWNPVTGCSKISPGCRNCYVEKMAYRLQKMRQRNYRNGFNLTVHQLILARPFSWKKPKSIFVNSMSDLFHEDVPEDFILKTFDVMTEADWHIFQVLTKRSERLLKLNALIDWPQNVWLGVSVENDEYKHRIEHLRQTDAVIKFLSLELLLGPLSALDLSGIDWVIAGGESGPNARPMESQWVIEIRDQCLSASLPFFFKQWGGVNKKKSGRLLDGRTWDEMPKLLKAV